MQPKKLSYDVSPCLLKSSQYDLLFKSFILNTYPQKGYTNLFTGDKG